MTGRALVFSHPKVIAALKADFIAVAVDKWYLSRQKDRDGDFFKKAAGERGPTQGLYVTDSDGTPLAADHFHPDPERFLKLLASGKEKFSPAALTPPLPGAEGLGDPHYDRSLPPGAWAVDVFTRLGVPEGGPWNPNKAIGRDHLWIQAAERDALLSGKVAPDLTLRLARFHLLDNVRGEPDFWQPAHVKTAKLTIEKGQLAGAFLLKSGKAGIELRMQGIVSARRFDAVAWGEAWGRGTYTPGEPPGRFPIAIGLSLAPQNDPARLVPPQGMKDFDGYGVRSSSQ